MKQLLVIAECVDTRSGVRYQPGEIFPSAAPLDQIERLSRSGCIRETDFSAAPPGVAAAVLATGAANALDAAADQAKAEAGRIAHGEATAELTEQLAKAREAAEAEHALIAAGLADARSQADEAMKALDRELADRRLEVAQQLEAEAQRVAEARAEADREIEEQKQRAKAAGRAPRTRD